MTARRTTISPGSRTPLRLDAVPLPATESIASATGTRVPTDVTDVAVSSPGSGRGRRR